MKRIRLSEKINRNNTAFNYTSRINTITPEILVSQIWLQDDDTPAMEIIELNSSDESDPSSTEAPQYNSSNAWSYINDSRFQELEDDYRVNKKARDKRRLKNKIKNQRTTNTSVNLGNVTRNTYNTGLSSNDDVSNENIKLNHQMNCFTIIDKHFASSDDSFEVRDDADVEVMTTDLTTDPNNWDNDTQYNEEIITYEPDVDTEKRTIWIYSFKNKRLLSENDFELVNIPSNDTSSCTSYSTETDEEQIKDKTTVCRLGSPIPPTYIPRLNLSLAQTLSTVTEITEPNKQPSSNDTETSLVNETLTRKPINSWIAKGGEKSTNNNEKATNVINWMGLSPRERRRRFRKVNTDSYEGQPRLTEVQTSRVHSFAEEKLTHITNHSSELKHTAVEIKVNVTADASVRTPTSINTIDTKVNIQPLKIMYADSFIEQTDNDDRGDYDRKNKLRKPQMILNPKMSSQIITEPIEKLESNNWIAEKSNEEPASHDIAMGIIADFSYGDIENKASNTLWKRNMPLMKPAQWSDYLPITASPQSLHLSLSSLNEDRPWFIRLVRCFKCFQ